MSIHIKNALDAVNDRFNSEITVAYGIQTAFENENFTLDRDNLGATQTWIRFYVVLGDRELRSIGGGRNYRMVGIGYAQIFSPLKVGYDNVAAVADYIDTETKFRSITAGGVTYRTPRIGQPRRERSFYRLDVEIPFYFEFSD